MRRTERAVLLTAEPSLQPQEFTLKVWAYSKSKWHMKFDDLRRKVGAISTTFYSLSPESN